VYPINYKKKDLSMLLLADSGSTKTDWLLMDSNQDVLSFKTVGFNPYFVDTEFIRSVITTEIETHPTLKDVTAVYFYGTGCSSNPKCKIVEDAMALLFPNAAIEVHHDLLSAGRALFGSKKGIAGILGTGSNSCLFDGQKVMESLFSLGYLFGDEGSGAYLGRQYLIKHLKKKVPGEIYKAFEEHCSISPEEILTHVYKKPNPSRFLASFAVFLKSQVDHPFIAQLVEQCFDDFFQEQIQIYDDYGDYTFSCIGSVGYNFRDQLQQAARRSGMTIGRIMASPMPGLREYHLGLI
jgi:glucosamine kinase